jgi:predicted nucleic acid-binding protein
VIVAAFSGGVLIAVTSGRQRTNHAALREPWAAALRSGTIATCAIVTLELIFSMRDAAEIHKLETFEGALRTFPVTVSVQRAAIGALRADDDVAKRRHQEL